MTAPKITITAGAYKVEGSVPLYQDVIAETDDGSHLEYRRMKRYETGECYMLCRCGRSAKKPFCDGRHVTEKPVFDAPEVADRRPYAERAKTFEGNGVDMMDDGRCAFARLCHYGGKSVWQMAEEDKPGEFRKEEVISAWHCPTGRLTVADAESGEPFEQKFEPSIVILEDAGLECSGPIFVRGGIPLIGEDGFEYEVQNRYALCRCGKSKDTPFCDATHHHIGFDDGFPKGEEPGVDASFDDVPKNLCHTSTHDSCGS